MTVRLLDWSHSCESCSWTGWTFPEIDADGRHVNPDGGTCPGPIVSSPSPTEQAVAAPARFCVYRCPVCGWVGDDHGEPVGCPGRECGGQPVLLTVEVVDAD